MKNKLNDITCVGCLSKEKFYFGKKNGFSLYKCKNCGMISLYEKPVASKEVYNIEYFSGGSHGFGYVNYDEDKEPMREGFKKYLKIVEEISGKKGRLFDVGAATGFFLSLAKDEGFVVSGVEISEFAARQAQDRGLSVATGTLETIQEKESEYDTITFLDVIEHMPSPEEDVSSAFKMLRKGGLLVINTPDSGSLYAKILGMKWHLIIPPEHIHYFNEKGIRFLLDRNGFEVVVLTRIGKKFTLEYILNMLFKWSKVQLFQNMAMNIKGTWLGTFALPVNLHDNMFLIARKV